MTVRAHYRAIEYRFTVETDIPEVSAIIDRLLAPFLDASSEGPRRVYRFGRSRAEDRFELFGG